MEPSSIIKGRDGAYYAFIRIDEYRSDQQRVCLLRTTDLANAFRLARLGRCRVRRADVDQPAP
jgi:hypothetical protein